MKKRNWGIIGTSLNGEARGKGRVFDVSDKITVYNSSDVVDGAVILMEEKK